MTAAATESPSVTFGPFVLDRRAGRLLAHGQAVDLAPRSWALLSHLVAEAGRLVSKDELLDAVWGHRHVSDSALKVTINSLRGRLGDDPAQPRFIETVARRGYRFIAPVAPLDAGAETPHSAPTAGQGPEDPAPSPAAARRAATGNLPNPATRLIGRDDTLTELRAQLASARLLTVLGPGGVGKTQLALSAAGVDAPADGAWLVRLDGLADAAPLLDTVARSLSLGANASRSMQTLAQALAPFSARLVLDNAEHLVDALVPLVRQCLADAPRLQILVTSQVPLRVQGEVLFPLAPLAVPPADPPPGTGAGGAPDPLRFPAVGLFIERVRALRPGYAPDAAEQQQIGALCRLLDGLPLAIELAAARVPLLGTAGVLARIGDRFALLSRGARDASERHRTLRQALEWSFALLHDDERRVLRRLSVFAGSFTPEMAQLVAGDAALEGGPGDADDWQVLDALQNLQDHSLLVSDAQHGGYRLKLLESVRALAAEQLRDAGEEATTRTRLVHALAERLAHAQSQYTRTPLLHWLAGLRPEADNLRAAHAHAIAEARAAAAGAPGCPPALQQATRLSSHALLFWLRSGRKREALAAHEALAPLVPRLAEPGLRATYGLAMGALVAYGQALPPAEAFPWLEEAEQTFTAQGETRLAMLALYLHAALLQRIAPTEDRGALLARMRALEGPDWTPRERNFSAWTEAVNAHTRGDLQTFRAFCEDDLARARASDDRAEAWLAAFGLGQALWILGERQRARDTLRSAVDDLRAEGLLREYATTAALGASMALALADTHDEAVAALREAADVTRAEGMLWWMGDALALVAARRGDWPAARRLKAWIDHRMKTLGMQRSPVATTLAEAFEALLATAEAPSATPQPEPPEPADLGDIEILRLSFG